MAFLRVQVEKNIYKDYELEKKRILIGRNSNNDIIIDSPSVSKCHAHINFEKGFFIIDQRSANGIFVNGKKVIHAKLSNKDLINFADIPATFIE